MAPTWCVVLPLLLGLLAPSATSGAARSPARMSGAAPTAIEAGQIADGWAWPVVGPVIRDFDPPEDPYGAGHRGIDIGAPVGTPILAPQAGVVSFAGKVGGQLFVTIDHGGGLNSTYSWLSAIWVRKGDLVARAGRIGLTGLGHPDAVVPHLHFGVRLDGVYLDPLRFLGPAPVTDVVHLAPDLPTPEPAPTGA